MRPSGTRSGDGAGTLRGGGRFAVHALPGPPPVVEKRGSPEALAREAVALRRLVARDVAPALVGARVGVLRTARLEGHPGNLPRRGPGDLHALGALLRRVHDTVQQRTGGCPAWRSPARTLSAYRRRRAADAIELAGSVHGPLAARVVASLPELPVPDEHRPFRFLHGDLVGENVVWTPGGPRLVDWEFWRTGDPAEDLAYLVEMNALTTQATDAVLTGYAVRGMLSRLDAWRALVALDAGAWYAREGMEQETARFLRRAAELAGGAPS